MWTGTSAHNPALAQSGVSAALLADLRADSHAAMPTNTVAATPAEQHADNSALRHIADADMTARQQVHLRTCPHSQLSYNSTPQQEGMRT